MTIGMTIGLRRYFLLIQRDTVWAARRSVRRSSNGNWSILKSPVCSSSPAAVRTAMARPSGDGVVDGHEFAVAVAQGDAVAGFDVHELRLEAVLLELGLHERQRQF